MKRKLNVNDVPDRVVPRTSSETSESSTRPPHDSTAQQSLSDAPAVVENDRKELVYSAIAEHGDGQGQRATFASLGLDARLLQVMKSEKLATPTLVQALMIPQVMDGKDVLARAKTGSGKTLAYLLPVVDAILRRKANTSSAGEKVTKTEAIILVPTKELAAQVTRTLTTITASSGNEINFANVARKEDDAVTRARLAETPNIVIATPSRAVMWAEQNVLSVEHVRHLVIDEADLVMSYGYKDDLCVLAEILSHGVQKMLLSATLRADTDTLTSLFYTKAQPVILDLSQEEAMERPTLAHYVVRTAEDEKFLLLYAIFKLQLMKGKVIIFVADVDRAYRVKLFLEQFGIRNCVLNAELPLNSRLHVVEEFNRGVYDILITSDDRDVGESDDETRMGRETEDTSVREAKGNGKAEIDLLENDLTMSAEPETENAKAHQAPSKRLKRAGQDKRDPEYSISRGIDFRAVSCVLNFDLPITSKTYLHRVGRTARAGKSGMAVSFCVPRELYRKHKSTSHPACENDEKVLSRIKRKIEAGKVTDPDKSGNGGHDPAADADMGTLQEWKPEPALLDGLRYRFTDALRAVTRLAVRQARTSELRRELLNSEKLKRHFEENPADLRHLRHDHETRAVRQMAELKHVPGYLLPNAGGSKTGNGDLEFVGLRREGGRRRERELRSRSKGKGWKGKVGGNRKSLDPLRSLNTRGRK